MSGINWKEWLTRLQNPTTVLAIVAEIIVVITALGLDINIGQVETVSAAIVGILILLGIMNNPTTKGIDVPTLGETKTEE